MKLKKPYTDLNIKTQDSGFYEGYSIPIALVSKIIISLLVVWALAWPEEAGSLLSTANWSTLEVFNSFYIYSVGFFAFFLIAIAILLLFPALSLYLPSQM